MTPLSRKHRFQISARFRELRGSQTQAQFAKFLGVRQQRISKLEREQPPTLDLLVRISNRCSVSIDWIVFGDA